MLKTVPFQPLDISAETGLQDAGRKPAYKILERGFAGEVAKRYWENDEIVISVDLDRVLLKTSAHKQWLNGKIKEETGASREDLYTGLYERAKGKSPEGVYLPEVHERLIAEELEEDLDHGTVPSITSIAGDYHQDGIVYEDAGALERLDERRDCRVEIVTRGNPGFQVRKARGTGLDLEVHPVRGMPEEFPKNVGEHYGGCESHVLVDDREYEINGYCGAAYHLEREAGVKEDRSVEELVEALESLLDTLDR
jgi:hypothetical protein